MNHKQFQFHKYLLKTNDDLVVYVLKEFKKKLKKTKELDNQNRKEYLPGSKRGSDVTDTDVVGIVELGCAISSYKWVGG